jgi:hypothetical protein
MARLVVRSAFDTPLMKHCPFILVACFHISSRLHEDLHNSQFAAIRSIEKMCHVADSKAAILHIRAHDKQQADHILVAGPYGILEPAGAVYPGSKSF